MAQQSHPRRVAQSPFRDAASRDHFRLWSISEVARRLIEVSSQRYSGPDLLTLSFSRLDPTRTWDYPAAVRHHRAQTSAVPREAKQTSGGAIGEALAARSGNASSAAAKVFPIPAFSFQGSDSIPAMILAKQRPKFPTALREPVAKPLLNQDP